MTIDKTMPVRDLITLFPVAADVLAAYNIHCMNCSMGGLESLEEGCRIHGMNDEEIEELIEDIQTAIADVPEKPMELTITKEAAEAVSTLASDQGHSGEALRVGLDEQSQFCMEFTKEKTEEDLEFVCSDVPEMKFYATELTLKSIGGAVIDFREERFKLDMEGGCCGGDRGGCGCEDPISKAPKLQ